MNKQETPAAGAPTALGWSASPRYATRSPHTCRSQDDRAKFRQAIERAFELPDGYTLQMIDRPQALTALMEFLVREGIRLRFSRIAVTVDEEEGLSWVRISGSQKVKAFLEEKIVPDKTTRPNGGRS